MIRYRMTEGLVDRRIQTERTVLVSPESERTMAIQELKGQYSQNTMGWNETR